MKRQAFVMMPLVVALTLPSVTRSDRVSDRIDALFATWAKPDSPGCGVAVSRNGVTVYEHGYGMANLDYNLAITPATVFPVASISKQFTAMSILLLAQRGRLSLDDDVRTYIPELPDYGTRITIRQLLTHTSGLRDAFLLLGLAGHEFGDRNEAVVKMLARQRGLEFTPGTAFHYNNGGYTMLGRIVARVSGQSLGGFADANIFKPLGMTHTRFLEDALMIIPNRATGYHQESAVFKRAAYADRGSPIGLVGNSGLLTTTGDLLRWEQNLADPRVGDPKLIVAMQTPTALTSGEPVPYGYGLFVGTHHGLKTVSHGGGGEGVIASVVRYPERGLAIAVVCNVDNNVDVSSLTNDIADLYLAASDTASGTPPSPAVTLSATQLASRAGLYRSVSLGTFLRLKVRGGALMGVESAGEEGDMFPLTPTSATRFVIPNTDVALELIPTAPGQPQELRVSGGGNKSAVLRQVVAPPFKPSEAELRGFGGDYRSDELDVTYTAVVRASVLRFETPNGSNIALQPLYRDAFRGYGVDVVEFTRDKRGTVNGFVIYASGAPGLRFTRAPGTRVATQ